MSKSDHRLLTPLTPPRRRSRAALGLAVAAAEGQFKLQVCADCGATQYPPRDACSTCLSTDLQWQHVDPTGTLLADTRIRISPDPYFRTKPVWRTGTVNLNSGPSVICHVHQEANVGETVRLDLKLDRAGQGVVMAFPEKGSVDMQSDPQLQEMICDPKERRVLITDGQNPNAAALANALIKAGAAEVFVGNGKELEAIEGVTPVALDLTSDASVRTLANSHADKIDILINNANAFQPGGVLARGDTDQAQLEMDVNFFGLMRLAQAFGPTMCQRTADTPVSSVAWVNILSVYALVNTAEYGCHAASHAAALSLSQNMRAEFQAAGLRVMNVFHGPMEDGQHTEVAPPKVSAGALARDVVKGMINGLEDIYTGDVAQEVKAKFDAGPKLLEREMMNKGV